MMVSDTLCRARVKACEQRIEKAEEKLEKHEETLCGVAECLAKLTALSEVAANELGETRTRVLALETKPANRWEKIITGVLTGGGGAVLGALLVKLLGA